MCWQWEALGVGTWSNSESKQAPGRSSELVERLLEPSSPGAVSGKLWAAVGRFLALCYGRRFQLPSCEKCQDKWYRNASLVLTAEKVVGNVRYGPWGQRAVWLLKVCQGSCGTWVSPGAPVAQCSVGQCGSVPALLQRCS